MASLSLRFPGCRICRLLMSSLFNGQENIKQFFPLFSFPEVARAICVNIKIKVIALAVFTVSALFYPMARLICSQRQTSKWICKGETINLKYFNMVLQAKTTKSRTTKWYSAHMCVCIYICTHICMSYLEKKNFFVIADDTKSLGMLILRRWHFTKWWVVNCIHLRHIHAYVTWYML